MCNNNEFNKVNQLIYYVYNDRSKFCICMDMTCRGVHVHTCDCHVNITLSLKSCSSFCPRMTLKINVVERLQLGRHGVD